MALHCLKLMLIYKNELALLCILQIASTREKPTSTNNALKTTATTVDVPKEKFDARTRYVAKTS